MFTPIEPGAVALVATNDGQRDNVMTITWTTAMDLLPSFAIAAGPWKHYWTALRERADCGVAIPTVDMIDTVIGVGTTSCADVDKFARFGLARSPASQVGAPLLPDCLAKIECRVEEFTERHGIVVLQALVAWIDPARAERRTLPAVGDGTFILDGERLEQHEAMRSKLPEGI